MSAVEAVTSQLAETSIDNPVEESASSIAAAEGRRLYIGNLPYSAEEAQIRDAFKDFDIVDVSIPKNPRTNRAVGYAFVDLKTKEGADKAVTELSGQDILGRKVSVQAARKPGAGPAQTTKESGEPRPPRRGRGGFRGGRGGGGRGASGAGPRRRGDNAREAPAAVAASTAADAPAATPAATAGAPKGDSPSSPQDGDGFRGRRKRGPPENGVASTTKVMVANLPYEITEEQLKAEFAAYNPESAKIALRPIPRFMVRKLQARGEARKGRGFGFVTLPSEELQKKAVDEMNGKVIEGREIAVKVAIDNPKADEEEGEEAAAAVSPTEETKA